MSLEVTKQELLKQAIYLKKLYETTRVQDYKDQETRIRKIIVDLDAFAISSGSQTLQDVTDNGSTTTNTIDTAGTKSDYFQLDTAATPTLQPGMFGWNDAYGTADLRLKGNNVTLQVGQETLARVVNKTGADLLESQYRVVRVRIASEGGAQGQRLAVVLAQGNNDPDSVTTLGIVTENIANNQEGFITIFGNVNGINTTGSLQGETWVDGDVLYLSPTTPGGLTKVKPTAPDHTVTVGYVVYAHANQGKIFVKVDNGYELDELHNVKITSVANNDLLQYDSTLQIWKNSAIGSILPNGLLKIASAISTTFQSVTDYLGNASVLFLNSRRVGIGKDTSVTTQSVAVVEVQDANTSIVLKPNGTGAIIASIPDGTATGGNSRGPYAVDLQTNRNFSTMVAAGDYSVIVGGVRNTVSAGGRYGAIIGGLSNTVGSDYGTIPGGASNSISSSTYSTISGGQSNTASTGTHATVVGGQSNTSSGYSSVTGGASNTNSAYAGVCFGSSNTSNGNRSFVAGNNSRSSGYASLAIGDGLIASGNTCVAFGTGGQSTGANSFSIGYYVYAQGSNSVGFGEYALANLFSQNTIASGRFSSLGDAQQSLLTARKSDTLTTAATTVLSLDGTGTTNLIIPNGNNRAWNVQIDTIAVVTAITGTATGVSVGDTYQEKTTLNFKRVGGTSSLVALGSRQQVYDTSMSTAIMNFSAGASQQLQLQFQSPTFAGGGSITCRIVSKVSLVEVAY